MLTALIVACLATTFLSVALVLRALHPERRTFPTRPVALLLASVVGIAGLLHLQDRQHIEAISDRYSVPIDHAPGTRSVPGNWNLGGSWMLCEERDATFGPDYGVLYCADADGNFSEFVNQWTLATSGTDSEEFERDSDFQRADVPILLPNGDLNPRATR